MKWRADPHTDTIHRRPIAAARDWQPHEPAGRDACATYNARILRAGQGGILPPVTGALFECLSPYLLNQLSIVSADCGVQDSRMSDRIYPRSPRETMCGWLHLPRYIDKIRLHLAGRLHADYEANLGKGFDERWLNAAGVTHDQMVEVVRNSITDGEVCDWVRTSVKRNETEKAAHAKGMLDYPRRDDAAMQERLKLRKEQSGLSHREEIRSFMDYIDADEKRI